MQILSDISRKKLEIEEPMVGGVVNCLLYGHTHQNELVSFADSLNVLEIEKPALRGISGGVLKVVESGKISLESLKAEIPALVNDINALLGKYMSTSFEPYFEKWKELNFKQKVVRKNIETLEKSLELSSDELCDDLHKIGADREINSSESRDLKEVFFNLFEKESKFVSTGISKSFDDWLQLEAGDMCVLAGRPAMGKSSFASQTITSRLKMGLPTPFFNLEMKAEPIMRRIAAQSTGLPLWKLKNRQLTLDDLRRAKDACQDAEARGIKIFDKSGQTVKQIENSLKQTIYDNKKKYGLETDYVVIDYLQLCKPFNPLASKVEQITDISRSIQEMLQNLGIAGLVLAQLSRDVEKRNDPIPKLSDLRESGAIEQDAHKVLFVFRPLMYDNSIEDKSQRQETFIIKEKDREGELGKFKFQFTPPVGTWEPMQ